MAKDIHALFSTLDFSSSFDQLSNIRLRDYLSAGNTFLDENRILHFLNEEGEQCIPEVRLLRDEIKAYKDTLQKVLPDFEKDILRRKRDAWRTFDTISGNVDFLTSLTGLMSKRQDLIDKKELLYDGQSSDTPYTLLAIDQDLMKTDIEIQRIMDDNRQCFPMKEMDALEEAPKYFKNLIQKTIRIEAMVDDFLSKNDLNRLIEEMGNSIRFADIVDFTYELFGDIFVSGFTKSQLLLLLNCQGYPSVPLKKNRKSIASVIILTIADYYDADPGFINSWEKAVLPYFGISEKEYSTRKTGHVKEKGEGGLAEKWKKPLTRYQSFLIRLNEFKKSV